MRVCWTCQEVQSPANEGYISGILEPMWFCSEECFHEHLKSDGVELFEVPS